MKPPIKINYSNKAKFTFIFALLSSVSYSSGAEYVADLTADANWFDLSTWQKDAGVADTLPTASDNVSITGHGNEWWTPWVGTFTDYTAHTKLYANNLTLNTVNFSTKDDSREGKGDWNVWSPSLFITNNLIINGGSMFSNQSWAVAGEGFDQIKIGGNFYVNSGTTNLGWGGGYSESHYALDVTGTVEIASGAALAINFNDSAWGAASTTHRIGGLNSNGGVLTRSGGQGSKTTIVFGGSDFKGGDFTGVIAAGKTNNNKLLLKMNSPNNQKQTLRIKSTTTYQAFASFDVEVVSGYMEISNDEDPTSIITSLTLGGSGKFGVASSASDTKLGAVNIGTLNWTSGTDLVFDLMQGGESDMIYLDALNFVSGESYNILFDLINFDDLDGETYDIIVKNSGAFSQADIDKLTGKTSDGLYTAIFELGGTDGNAISVSFVVPEPSTVAAILGAFALGFAAWRKRK